MKTKKVVRTILFVIFISIFVLTGCSKGKDSYKRGVNAYEDGNFEVAAQEFSEAINENSDNGDYFLSYGNTLIVLENYEEAINVFNQVITDKDSKIVRQNNKKAYYSKGIAYFNMKDYDKAIEQFDLALLVKELDDLNLDILLYKGDTQIEGKMYEDAKETLTLAIELESKNPNVYYKRSNVYKELGEYNNAEADLDIGISREPDSYDYHFAKYYLLKEQNKDDAADKVLDSITSIKINDSEDLYNSGKANFYLGHYEAASNAFTSSIEEGIIEANYYLGKIMEQDQDYQGAITYYEAFLSSYFEVNNEDSNNDYIVEDYKLALTYNQMGYSYLELVEYEKALESFDKGLEFYASSVQQSLLRNKVVALEHLNKYEEAHKVLIDYLADYPEDEEAKRELEFVKTRLPGASNVVDEE